MACYRATAIKLLIPFCWLYFQSFYKISLTGLLVVQSIHMSVMRDQRIWRYHGHAQKWMRRQKFPRWSDCSSGQKRKSRSMMRHLVSSGSFQRTEGLKKASFWGRTGYQTFAICDNYYLQHLLSVIFDIWDICNLQHLLYNPWYCLHIRIFRTFAICATRDICFLLWQLLSGTFAIRGFGYPWHLLTATFFSCDICCLRHLLSETFVTHDMATRGICFLWHLLSKTFVFCDICYSGHLLSVTFAIWNIGHLWFLLSETIATLPMYITSGIQIVTVY